MAKFMCFSASASFITASVIIPIGLYSTYKAFRFRPAYLMLALIPLLFGVQQIAEALVWLSLQHQNMQSAQHAALIFLFFAIMVWPCWIALSILLTELDPFKRKLLAIVAISSFITGIILYIPLLQGKIAMNLGVKSHSICYDIEIASNFLKTYSLFYLGFILASTLITSQGLLRVFGCLILTSFIISYLCFDYAFTSVWCFFAALISMLILYMFYKI